MNKAVPTIVLIIAVQLSLSAQNNTGFKVPEMPDKAQRMATLQSNWEALQKPTPAIGVRDGFLFLLDALDTKFLKEEQLLFVLDLLQSKVVTDSTAPFTSYGNIYWGWHDKLNDIGDGNNVEFCVQYGILMKYLFNDRMTPKVGEALDRIFTYAMIGVKRQPVRISYTNIYVMRIWNLIALGQIYHRSDLLEEGRKSLNLWLQHVSRYGNREYDSPTYCGVDLESLVLLERFAVDPDIKTKAGDAIRFLFTDLLEHYNKRSGVLEGAHSRDYNRVFSRDLLEEKYLNPLFGRPDNADHLFHEICFSLLQEQTLASQYDALTAGKRFIVQRWDSLPNTYACDYRAEKFSIASSNQAYSPDDKPFVIYLSSNAKPALPNIAFVMEGRNDHYGRWSAEGMGEKLKHLMPPNYPANGGWNKDRHLMPFMQSAQNKNEFVMLVSGEKDQNCINAYLNSTVILPDAFNELWIGNDPIKTPPIADSVPLYGTRTLFARFEDVVVAIRILYDDATEGSNAILYNDGFRYASTREKFSLANNGALRLTLRHSDNGKAKIAMWWKVQDGITSDAAFKAFRQQVLDAPVTVTEKDGVIDVRVITPAGKLGVRADLIKKQRISYENPVPLPANFLLNVNGNEIGRTIMEKYAVKNLQ